MQMTHISATFYLIDIDIGVYPVYGRPRHGKPIPPRRLVARSHEMTLFHPDDLTNPARTDRARRRLWRRVASLRVGLHTRNVLTGAALCALMILLALSAAAQLAPSVQADLYLVQTEEYIKEKNYKAAQEAMGKIIGLQEEHGLQLPHEFHFKYAQVLDWAGSYAEAIESLNRYLELAGRSGTHYRDALLLLHQTMEKEASKYKDDEAFGSAKETGTMAAYRQYLSSYPDGSHSAEARRLLAQAEQQARRQAQVAAQARDDTAFRSARATGTAAAYREYLSSYPDGRHAAEARRLLARAEEEEADLTITCNLIDVNGLCVEFALSNETKYNEVLNSCENRSTRGRTCPIRARSDTALVCLHSDPKVGREWTYQYLSENDTSGRRKFREVCEDTNGTYLGPAKER